MDAVSPTFDLEPGPDAAIITVRGEVDLASSPQLETLIERTPPEKLLVVDLTDCTYLDSSTLTVFVRAFKARGPRLRLVIPQGARIRRLFELTKLADVLSVAHSRSAALE